MLTSWIRLILLVRYFYTTHSSSLFDTGDVPTVEFQGKSYFFSFTFKADWYSALNLCDQMGMQLVSVTSSETSDFLLSNINANNKANRFWTAGTKLLNNREWFWITTAKLVNYTNWLKNEPNNLDKEHVFEIVWKSGTTHWNNVPSNYQLNFICESPDDDRSKRNYWKSVFADPLTSPNFDVFYYNSSTYYVSKLEQMTYWNAHRFCKAINMDLVSIDSKEENNRIYKYIRDSLGPINVWSGATMLINNKNWYWLPSGNSLSFTNWNEGEPDVTNKKQYCLELSFKRNFGVFWHNEDCRKKNDVICESSTGNIETRSIFDRCKMLDKNNTHNLGRSVQQYYIGKEKKTFAQAIEKCKSMGLMLVSLQTYDKQHAVNIAIKNSGVKASLFWTSGNQLQDKLTWRWMSGEVITKSFWKSEFSQITGTAECLSIMEKEGVTHWYHAPCSRQYYYICEEAII